MARIVTGVFMLTVSIVAMGQTPQNTKCEANINGFKIHNVYITGTSYKAVDWAYKHLSERGCLTPVTSLAKADAILELVMPQSGGGNASGDDVLSVTCSGSAGSSQCIDSDGNEMDVSCDSAGNCSSYYGPSLAHAVGGLVTAMIESSVGAAEGRLYTLDHKLVWKSELVKAKFPYSQWDDKINMPPLAPPCMTPGMWDSHARDYLRNWRHWASTHCGITIFDPLVSIDLKVNNRLAQKAAKQGETDEMLRNAKDAAAKQKQGNP